MGPGLPLVLALHIHDVSAAVIALVGLIALALAVVGFRARSRNRALRFVTFAFVVFGVKGLFSAWAIATRSVGHEDLELVLALADLVVVSLLVAPLLLKPSTPA